MPARHLELAHAKLTLSLRITGTRADGYHLIEAEMVSVDLADRLVFSEGDGFEVEDAIDWRGEPPRPAVPVNDTNLVRRALKLLERRAHVALEKKIPMGAGLGGGSSDAAAVLRWAGVDDLELAARLGADVPFCLRGGRAIVSGVGERLEPQRHLQRSFLLVSPALFVSTPSVYRAFDELGSSKQSSCANDLERAALAVEPRLEELRRIISSATGERPLLAGSGSTYFVEVGPGAHREQHVLERALEKSGFTALVQVVSTVERSGPTHD